MMGFSRSLVAAFRAHVGRWCAALLVVLPIGMVSGPSHGAYVQRFSANANGAITFTGNTLGLSGGVDLFTPGINDSAGAFINSNNAAAWGTYPANTVGAAAASTTLWSGNASQAVLNIPAGSTVLYAELIWGGAWSYGGATLIPAQMNSSVTLSTPRGSYSVAPAGATAQTAGAGSGGTCTTAPCRYMRSQNVTGLVALGGAGTYAVAGVPAAYGNDANSHVAGWTLAVVYSHSSLPARNLTVFTGLEVEGQPAAAVSGFCTPTTGAPQGRLLVSAMEGDSGRTGDQMMFGPTTGALVALSGPNNPANNFFASQINRDTGALDTSGTHGTRNHPAGGYGTGMRHGWDITNVDVGGVLVPNQSTAYAQGTSSSDQYHIIALAMQIDLGAPRFPSTVLSVDKSTTFVGDVLTYTVVLNNQAPGNAHATNVVFTNTPPPGTVFRAGTVTVNGIPQPAYNPVAGFNLGTISAGTSATVTFQVDVVSLPAAPAPARFDNQANWTYQYVPCVGIAAQNAVMTTNVATSATVRLAPTKTVSPAGAPVAGQVLTYTITVPNSGLANTAGARLVDPIPAGTTYLPNSTRMNGILVADSPGPVMPFAAGALINSPARPAGQINAGESVSVQFQVTVNASPPASITNTASIDQDGAGPAPPVNVSAISSSFTPPAAAKAFAPASIVTGGVSTLTITLSNANGAVLTGAAFTDTLPAGLTIANPANATSSCGGTVGATPGLTVLALSGGAIPASASCTVTASVTASVSGSYTNILAAGSVTTTNAGVNTVAANALLTVTQAPVITKAFSPATVLPNAASTLTITLTNPTSLAMINAAFMDTLPLGLVVAASPAVTNSCGGSITANAGTGVVSLTGGTIGPVNICTVSVNVTAATGGTYINTIAAGALSTSGGANAASASATLTVAAPQVSKAFSINPVALNTNTTLTITLFNPSSIAITGVALTDTYPSGLVNAPTPGAATTCGGSVSTTGAPTPSVSLSGGTIPAQGSCTVTVAVRSGTAGTYVNTIPAGGVTSTNAGSNSVAASASLSVGRPSVSKAFTAAAIVAGGSTPLVITLTNPNGSAATINNSPLLDVLPSGMVVAATPALNETCTGGVTTINAPSGGSTIGIVNGTIPANGSCTVSVTITSNTPGNYVNTIAAGALDTSAGPNGLSASDTLLVVARPTIAKSFSTTSIAPSGSSTLTIVLSNSNAVDITGVTFNDVFPTSPGAMTVAAPLTATNTCGGTLLDSGGTALAAGDVGIRLTGGAIPANSSCTVTVTVTATVGGTYTNSIAIGALTGTGATVALSNAAAATANLAVSVQPPAMTKAFAVNPVGTNEATALAFTITNPNPSTPLTGVAFTDTFPTLPSGMVVANPPVATTSGCGTPTFTPTAGAASISMSGGAIAANGTCVVSVNVVVPNVGTYNNVSGTVTSTNGGAGITASATLTAPRTPIAAKSFALASAPAGSPVTLTITISNPNASTTLTGVAILDAYPSGMTNFAAGSVACTVGSSATLTGGLVGGSTVGITGGTLSGGGSCTITASVSASTAGSYLNTTANVTSTIGGTGNTASATLTVTPVAGVAFSGYAYLDANANASRDGSEAGTGLTLHAKLIQGGVTQQVAAINPTTGLYTFASVTPGTYTLILDDNNSIPDVTPTIPSGWIGTENPSFSRVVTVGSAPVLNQNFGLTTGNRITGRVFADTGAGGGIANDGIPNGAETGIANVTVWLTNCGATTHATTASDGAGNYALLISGAVPNGATLCVVQTNLGATVSTGGQAGTTGGAYDRANDRVQFVYTAGTNYSGVNFGDVPANQFLTDGSRSALAGATLYFSHSFIAGSTGAVSFTTSASAAPAMTGWSEVIYRDTNCNGALDAGEPQVAAAIAMVAGDHVCVLVKQFVPANAPIGAQNIVTIQATFTYTNAAPALSNIAVHTDVTTVGTRTSAGLALAKAVDRLTALPGDVLVYTITYRNDSSGPLSSIVITDGTPAFTIFLAASCAPNPPNITLCAVTTQPPANGTGGIVWTLTGSLAPGATSTVTYSVRVAP
jgi:uncharacterized repeat protein (TIGR01451 family)